MSMSPEQVDYTVVVHHEDDSYWAEVAELPGCFISGDTMDELWEALPEAVGIYLSTPASQVRVTVEGHDPGTQSHSARVLVCS